MPEKGEVQIKRILTANLLYFSKWIIIGIVLGALLGAIGAAFYHALVFANFFRNSNPWVIWLLPIAGVIIVFLYRLLRDSSDKGTNLVIISLSRDEHIPIQQAPLVFLSTILTHMFGGSAGREGAALQIGGSIGQNAGYLLRLNNNDRETITMAGMAGGFAALFGTPLTAAIFAMEISCIGVIRYSAFLPCAVCALSAAFFSKHLGAVSDTFAISKIPAALSRQTLLAVLLSILCALVSILFCMAMHMASRYFAKLIKNAYIRIAAGGLIVAFLTFICGTSIYNGAGLDIIEQAINGSVPYEAFALKIVFTALTLGAGYKGGEIVPSLYVGATFGSVFAALFGQEPAMFAAIGMASLFCGITNCPIASIFLCLELFGYNGMPFYLLAVAFSYTFSGYFGVYGSQKVIAPKPGDEDKDNQISHKVMINRFDDNPGTDNQEKDNQDNY